MQGRLLPLDIVRLDPSRLGTADLEFIGIGDDGLAYAIKDGAKAPLLPASELICTRLAETCNLPVPPGLIARLPNESLVFASRWEGGTLAEQEAKLQLVTPGAVSVAILSKLLVFDLFVGNPDRHAGNFLMRRDSHHQTPALLAFDFSRALLMAGWPIPIPPSDCNTRILARVLKRLHGYDAQAGQRLMDRLCALPDDTMACLCQDLPPEWLPDNRASTLTAWWTDHRQARIEQIAEVIDHAL